MKRIHRNLNPWCCVVRIINMVNEYKYQKKFKHRPTLHTLWCVALPQNQYKVAFQHQSSSRDKDGCGVAIVLQRSELAVTHSWGHLQQDWSIFYVCRHLQIQTDSHAGKDVGNLWRTVWLSRTSGCASCQMCFMWKGGFNCPGVIIGQSLDKRRHAVNHLWAYGRSTGLQISWYLYHSTARFHTQGIKLFITLIETYLSNYRWERDTDW